MIDDSLDPLRKMVIGEFALFSLRVKALEDRPLPVPAPSPVPVPARKTYIAVAGDNLSVIAARNNLSLAEIERLNPQFSPNFDLIHPGDLVYLS
jgi:LysM repeat protein